MGRLITGIVQKQAAILNVKSDVNSTQSILIRAESMSCKQQTRCAVSIETEGGTIKKE